jgi:hypothetical protein
MPPKTSRIQIDEPTKNQFIGAVVARQSVRQAGEELVLFLPRPSNRVRKLLCNLRSSNYRRVQSTRRSTAVCIIP